jgi:5-methylcytosine-specific restriction endonuclease McrA
MTISDEKRHAVREQYNFACGYCGISEIDAGSELEIDHFQPIK